MLLDAKISTLLVIDIQENLMPAVFGSGEIQENVKRLLEAARLMHVSCSVTEQYPNGLGHTVEDLDLSGCKVIEKTSFNACGAMELPDIIPGTNAVVVCGAEAHVCVLQTVFGLIARGYEVYVVADAIGSRTKANKAAAISRMEKGGAHIVSTEMVLFEWLGDSKHPKFGEVLKLIK